MNQRNPFTMHMQSSNITKNIDQDILNEAKAAASIEYGSRENTLLAELAFERKRYAEIELVLINQKANSTQVLIQNFEIRVQQLKRDVATYINDAADKKKEIEELSKEYEDRKKLINESK
jgi:hypothetical protein